MCPHGNRGLCEECANPSDDPTLAYFRKLSAFDRAVRTARHAVDRFVALLFCRIFGHHTTFWADTPCRTCGERW